MNNSSLPDLDAIARNLIALDLAHLTPEESTAYEHELSVIAALNEALETAALALRTADPPPPSGSSSILCFPMPMPSLLSSQLAPLIDLNAERSFPITERPVEKTAHAHCPDPPLTAFYFPP